MLQQRGLKCCISELVYAECSKERILPDAVDEIFHANENAALRTAEQFISAGGNQVHAEFERLSQARFPIDSVLLKGRNETRALIFKQGDAGALCESYQFPQQGPL